MDRIAQSLSIVIGVVMSLGIGSVFYSPEVWQLK